jgi:hypothetical protein
VGVVVAAGAVDAAAGDVGDVTEDVDEGVALALALEGFDELVDVVKAVVSKTDLLLSPVLTSQIKYVSGSTSCKSVARYKVVQTEYVAPLQSSSASSHTKIVRIIGTMIAS